MSSIYLSPSTQEANIGVGDYGTEEQRMNEVADTTQNVLERHGITVYRNKPGWALSDVVADSNAKNPDIHLAVHSNALDGKTRGCEVFCYKFGGSGEKLARNIYSELSPLTPGDDRGVKEGYNFYGAGKPMYELARTIAPAALVEVSFHDNPEDAQWIMSNIELIGTALAKGVLAYFNVQYEEEAANVDAEISILQNHGIIDSPEYWKENAVKGKTITGENAAFLIKKVAAFLSKTVTNQVL